MPARGFCATCEHPQRGEIDKMLAGGASINSTRYKFGLSMKTVTNHRDRHVLGVERLAEARMKALRATSKGGVGQKTPKDFATAVREKAMQLMESGGLEVTTRDGLQAQALIDRRTEKEKDREFVLNLARLLSGAGRGAPAEIVDGEYLVLDGDDDGDMALLAPVSVREP